MEQPAQGNRAKLRIGVAAALLATAVIILVVLNQRQPAAPVASLPAPPPSNISSADNIAEAASVGTAVPAEAELVVVEPPPPPVVGTLPAPTQVAAAHSEKATEPGVPASVPTRSAARSAEPKAFEVQLGVFTDLENARQLQARLTQQGIASHSETRVQVGPFKTRAEADQARNKLKALGLNPVIIAE